MLADFQNLDYRGLETFLISAYDVDVEGGSVTFFLKRARGDSESAVVSPVMMTLNDVRKRVQYRSERALDCDVCAGVLACAERKMEKALWKKAKGDVSFEASSRNVPCEGVEGDDLKAGRRVRVSIQQREAARKLPPGHRGTGVKKQSAVAGGVSTQPSGDAGGSSRGGRLRLVVSVPSSP